MSEPDDRRALVLATLRKQADVCTQMGSAIYGDLFARCAEDYAAGGIVASLIDGWQGHPVLDNIAMRLLGAAHFLALRGDAPELAACFPSTGGRYDAARAWPALRDTLARQADHMRLHLTEQVQTNEVRRCCALLGGFVEISRACGLPLRLLEIGASAGLNQCFDQYAYLLGDQRIGPASAPLALDCEWRGPALEAAGVPLCVTSRAGCDLFPIDVRDAAQRMRLESYFWPDQLERIARLRAACECATRAGVSIERASAGDWLARELATLPAGVTSVLFHSVMWLYVPKRERERISELLEDAGARANAERPLAWLRLEPPNFEICELRLRIWPGGSDRLLARSHPHGAWVEWLGA